MRIVIDTNVVVSAMFFGGRPRELLELLVSRKLGAYASAEIITEYQETTAELCAKYPRKDVRLPLAAIIACMEIIEPTSVVDICRDSDDNKFIECAMDAQCMYIVSGDKDLLSIGNYNQVEIVTVSELLSRYHLNKSNQ